MDQQSWETEQFELHRRHLQAVAYRMLGSVGEAEDAVQEAWVRLRRADTDEVSNVGGWLPEPVVTAEPGAGPEQEALLADSVGLALLVVLDTLTPAERLAFVLHDMFDVPFDDLAPIVGRSPAATRQLASRARRRVRGAAPPPDPDTSRQREVVDAFLAAARAGDFEALVEVLDPDVAFRIDGGSPARPVITGAPAVARQVLGRGARFAPHARPAIVNGTAGFVVGSGTAVRAVAGFTVVAGRIATIDIITEPEKLRGAAGAGA